MLSKSEEKPTRMWNGTVIQIGTSDNLTNYIFSLPTYYNLVYTNTDASQLKKFDLLKTSDISCHY